MRESLFDWPSTIQPSDKAGVVDPCLSRPVGNGHSLPAMLNESGGAGVVHLLASRRPPAVLRRIWAVIVNAVQFVTVRTRPHVRKEDVEILEPSFVHEDPSATVPAVVLSGLDVATGLCPVPCLIFPGKRSAIGPATGPVLSRLLEHLRMKASAALGLGKQVPGRYEGEVSAFASASPLRLYSLLTGRPVQDSKSSEHHSFKVVFDRSSRCFHSTSIRPTWSH